MSLIIQPPASSGLSAVRTAPAATSPYAMPSPDAARSTETHVALAALLTPSTPNNADERTFANANFENVLSGRVSDFHAGVAEKSQIFVPTAAIDQFARSTINGMLEFIKTQGGLLLAQLHNARLQENPIKVRKIDDQISRFLQNTNTSLKQLARFLIEDQTIEKPSRDLESKMRIVAEICQKISAYEKADVTQPSTLEKEICSSDLESLRQQNGAKKLTSILFMI